MLPSSSTVSTGGARQDRRSRFSLPAAWLLGALLAASASASPSPDLGRAVTPSAVEILEPRAVEVTHEWAEGHIEEIAVGHLGSGPAIVAVGPDDAVWVALARLGAVGRYSNGRLDLFPLGADSRPVGVIVGSRENGYPGELWVAASFDNKIIRFDPQRGTRRDYAIEGETSWPFNIAIHPDGGLWFTQRASGRLGRLDPESGAVRHYEPPTPSGGPAGLAINPRSGRIWFTESYADRIAYLDPGDDSDGEEARIREIVLGDASTGLVSGPAGMAVAPDGSVYFAKLEGLLGRAASDASGPEDVELIPLPEAARRPAGVVVGADGTVWAGALDGNLIVRYEPEKRHVTLFPIPTGAPDLEPSQPPFARTSRPFGIATDSRGHLWFSEQYAGQLAVLDTTAPAIEVLWPTPRRPITGASTPVTLRLDDRSGIDRLTLSIDGEVVQRGPAGRLDLSALEPGEHLLAVEARDRGGHTARVQRPFVYRPNHLALIEMIEAWKPDGGEASAGLRQDLLKIAGRMPRDRRAGLDAFEERLRSADAAGFPKAALLAQVHRQRGQRGARIDVALLDHPPFFKPRRVKLAPGDTVVFSYQPAMRGHELPKAVHKLELRSADGAVSSPKLRAGESFSHTFEAAGRFEIVDVLADAGRPASMRIEVKP